jgi:hypothetical protein
MGKRVMDGPPWCGVVDPEEAYFRGMARSMGSGLLGGWSCATSGGSFVSSPREIEARQELARLAAARRQPLPEAAPAPHSVRPRHVPALRHREGRVPPLRPHAR